MTVTPINVVGLLILPALSHNEWFQPRIVGTVYATLSSRIVWATEYLVQYKSFKGLKMVS
jgi:hypothetical protein